MTPVRWGPPGWVFAAAPGVLLVLGLLFTRAPPPPARTEPSGWCVGIAGAKVPEHPFPQQAAPLKDGSCADKRSQPINGGCWVPLEPKPEGADGCGGLGWEHAGKCWMPVATPRRQPQTATP